MIVGLLALRGDRRRKDGQSQHQQEDDLKRSYVHSRSHSEGVFGCKALQGTMTIDLDSPYLGRVTGEDEVVRFFLRVAREAGLHERRVGRLAVLEVRESPTARRGIPC